MSKLLKSVKQQNKELKEAVTDQKANERAAKLAYQESKAGLFASKDERLASQRAKRNYEQAKADTAYGKSLLQHGKQMKSSLSREAGLFGNDAKISAASRGEAEALVSKAKSFVSERDSKDAKKSKESENVQKSKGLKEPSVMQRITNGLDNMSDKMVGAILGSTVSTTREVPNIVNTDSKDAWNSPMLPF